MSDESLSRRKMATSRQNAPEVICSSYSNAIKGVVAVEYRALRFLSIVFLALALVGLTIIALSPAHWVVRVIAASLGGATCVAIGVMYYFFRKWTT